MNCLKFQLVLQTFLFISCVYGSLTIDKVDVKVIQPDKGTCAVKINKGPPKSVDYDVHAFVDADDVMLRFGAFSEIEGKFNEIIESEEVSICNLANSENPLVAFVYKEMSKVGNLTAACPIKKGYYYMHGFTLYESDVPIPLPSGNFKLEVNGSFVDGDKLSPLFTSDIYFSEAKE
ncbi:hypothetical protein PVAND_015277 [Polypedilum vanderplanki]|uniref:MD-2-related lipid-recognition domain-containing protein n=1 Tax=Polypedilum vanderplanki TaxID=319348 RepID=A0A9J6BCL6_POLVA|nr:hypothetical protein PVAND_015277 [Polypedilum vanderplanki]